jgi:hypothetical protein
MKRLSGMVFARGEMSSIPIPLRKIRSSVPMAAPSPVNARL